MEFKDIATISGKSGLYQVLKPTRNGVILETLDDTKKKVIVNSSINKVSIFAEISIYTTDDEGSTPLEEVMKKIHSEFNGDTGLSKNSDPDELKSFMQHILPGYDTERVYVSDIKKLVGWYATLAKEAPNLLEVTENETVTDEQPANS